MRPKFQKQLALKLVVELSRKQSLLGYITITPQALDSYARGFVLLTTFAQGFIISVFIRLINSRRMNGIFVSKMSTLLIIRHL